MDLLVRGASFLLIEDSHAFADIPSPVTFGCRRTDPALTWPAYEYILERTCAEGTVRRPQRSPQKTASASGEKLRLRCSKDTDQFETKEIPHGVGADSTPSRFLMPFSLCRSP
jgi:hypothetical protein